MNLGILTKKYEEQKNIKTISNLNPTLALSSFSIRDTVRLMISSGHRSLPVVDKKRRLEGIVTLTDILDAFLRYENFNEPISKIMTREVIFANENDSIDFTLQKMKISRKGRIPISNSKKEVVGVISERDVIKHYFNFNFNKPVSEICMKKPLFVSPHLPLVSCMKNMVNTKFRRFPVVDNKEIVGMITVFDLVKDLEKIGFRHNFVSGEVKDLMTKEVVTVKPEDDISRAVKLMVENRNGMLPVVDQQGKIFGIVTERDILEELL